MREAQVTNDSSPLSVSSSPNFPFSIAPNCFNVPSFRIDKHTATVLHSAKLQIFSWAEFSSCLCLSFHKNQNKEHRENGIEFQGVSYEIKNKDFLWALNLLQNSDRKEVLEFLYDLEKGEIKIAASLRVLQAGLCEAGKTRAYCVLKFWIP